MKRMKNPCMNCTNETGRCIGCHDACSKYQDWHNNNKLIKKEKEKQRMKGMTYFDSLSRAIGKKNVSGISGSNRNRYVF